MAQNSEYVQLAQLEKEPEEPPGQITIPSSHGVAAECSGGWHTTSQMSGCQSVVPLPRLTHLREISSP